MILRILENMEESEITGDTYTISVDYLNHIATHLYLASQQWDSLYCELSDSIPLGCLKNIRTKVKDVTVKIPDNETKKTMQLLAELYPEKSGTLRKQFMLGRSLKEVL